MTSSQIADGNCPFCRIVASPRRYEWLVHADEYTVAFFPDEPATLGHTLVVPRRHVSFLWDLDSRQASQCMETILLVSRTIRQALAPNGLNVVQSNGDVAGQTVFHVHFHLVPRWPNDSMPGMWPEETNYSKEEKRTALESIVEVLRPPGGRNG